MKEPNKFHIYETEKITRKASDAAEYRISSCSVLSPEIVMHDAFSELPPIYVSSCMTISGERTEQHVVIGFGELAVVD